jgi:hypothetical protein
MPAKGQTKYNEDRHNAIINAIEQGVPYRHAAAIAGISEDTMAAWRKRFPAFSDAIKAAEGRAVAGRLARIRLAEPHSWQAAAWWLERKYPLEFGRTIQDANINLTVNVQEVASKVAQDYGLDPDAVIAEAERIVAGKA